MNKMYNWFNVLILFSIKVKLAQKHTKTKKGNQCFIGTCELVVLHKQFLDAGRN